MLLVTPKKDLFFVKVGGKKNLVETPDFGDGKMVFILLNRIVTIYIKPTFIYVRCSSLKKSLLRLIKVFLYRGLRLWDRFKDQL